MSDWGKFAESYNPLSKQFTDPTEDQVAENIAAFGPDWSKYASVILDHYKYLVHLAIANCADVRINAFDLELADYTLGLGFSASTDLKTPIGRSQIIGGLVSTVEPLEILLYGRDIEATEKLTSLPLDISSYEEDGLHTWDWKAQSTGLDFKTTYVTSLRDHDYSVDIDMRHLLGLTMPRMNLRFMNNRLAAVTVKMWFHEIFSQIADLQKMIAKSRDEVKTATYQAQLSAFNMLISKQLIAIGGTTMGNKGTSYIKHSIQRQMFDLGALDDYTHLHVGVQATLLNLWMGLTTLECLNLLTQKDISKITAHIRSSGVLAHVVAGSVDLPIA
jgi:hypothetical protein